MNEKKTCSTCGNSEWLDGMSVMSQTCIDCRYGADGTPTNWTKKTDDIRLGGRCEQCVHKEACERWVRHGTTLYDDFVFSTEGCPCYKEVTTDGQSGSDWSIELLPKPFL